jgi:hypothetical protein
MTGSHETIKGGPKENTIFGIEKVGQEKTLALGLCKKYIIEVFLNELSGFYLQRL